MTYGQLRRYARQARVCSAAALCALALLLGGAPPARAASATWTVSRPGDDAADGDLSTHSGSLRFVLAHAVSGDQVAVGEIGADAIFIAAPLAVPAGVAVGGPRGAASCGSYAAPRLSIIDATGQALDPVISLGAGAALHGVDLGGGRITIRVTGADVDICGVGVGVTYDGDGVATALPPASLSVSIDGPRAVVRRSYLNGAVAVSPRGSDSRIGDALDGSGDGNDGVRDAAVTVLADQAGAARRVTVRDPFPRGLFGLDGAGVAGGDDDPLHANNWAQTPTILSATTADGFATVQVRGLASPRSLVDIYLDNALSITRQAPVVAGDDGRFSFSGPLAGGQPAMLVIAASTLADAAHQGRVGSSSRWSAPATIGVRADSGLQIAPPALALTAWPGGPATPATFVSVTTPVLTPTMAWQLVLTTSDGAAWLHAATTQGSGDRGVAITADPTGLAAGIYTGAIAVRALAGGAAQGTTTVTFVVQTPQLSALGAVADLDGAPAGTARPGDRIRLTVTLENVGPVAVRGLRGALLQPPAGASVTAGSGQVLPAGGFSASDSGFSGGGVAVGARASYTLDAVVATHGARGAVIFTMEVGGDGIVTIPVVGRIRIVGSAPPGALSVYLPIVSMP